jgi:hypothetical protein
VRLENPNEIILQADATLSIADSILTCTLPANGPKVETGASIRIERSLFQGFSAAVSSRGGAVEITDAVFVGNRTAVAIEGHSCGASVPAKRRVEIGCG